MEARLEAHIEKVMAAMESRLLSSMGGHLAGLSAPMVTAEVVRPPKGKGKGKRRPIMLLDEKESPPAPLVPLPQPVQAPAQPQSSPEPEKPMLTQARPLRRRRVPLVSTKPSPSESPAEVTPETHVIPDAASECSHITKCVDIEQRKGEDFQTASEKRQNFMSNMYKSSGPTEFVKAKLCMYFARGNCREGDRCGYEHDASIVREVDYCKRVLTPAGCNKETCQFSHDLKKYPCRYFFATSCDRNDCAFHHNELKTQKEKFDFVRVNRAWLLDPKGAGPQARAKWAAFLGEKKDTPEIKPAIDPSILVPLDLGVTETPFDLDDDLF